MSIQLPDPNFIPIATEPTIMLSDTSIQWAADICQTITDIDKQWHSFIQALALAGVNQWLHESSTPLTMTYPRSAAPTAHTYGQVGGFRLCILPMGALKDSQVAIPAAQVKGRHRAHLYLLVNVHEEVEQVHVVAGLDHDYLAAYIQHHSVQVNDSYMIPTEQFTVRPETLLWYLTCLQPETIIPRPVDDLAQQVINTAQWLQGQLDEVAEQLAWQLMPALSYGFRGALKLGDDDLSLALGLRSSPMRGNNDLFKKLAPLLKQLNHNGIDIPSDAVGAAKKVMVGQTSCLVYTLLWQLLETREWSLFVLLGPADDQPLPLGMALQVSDDNSVMSRHELRHDSEMTFLYIQAIGNLDEQFTVELGAPGGAMLVLPSFGFEPVMG